MLGASPFVETVLARRGGLIGKGLLTRLDRVSGLLIDNAQLRHVLDHPVRFRIEARNALAGVWVF